MTDDPIEKFRRSVAAKSSQGTADAYVTDVRRFRDWLEERDKSLEDAEGGDELEEHLEDLLDQGYAKKTVLTAHSAVGRYYEEMHDWPRDVDDGKNPVTTFSIGSWDKFDTVEPQKEKEERTDLIYLVPEKVRELRNHVPQPVTRNELLIETFFQTGVRVGELSKIRLKDIEDYNEDTGRIEPNEHVIRIRNEKKSRNRVVTYQKSLDGLLRDWLIERNTVLAAGESEYLFPTERSEHITPKRVNQVVKEAAESAGLQKDVYTDKGGKPRKLVTAHTLRHSYAMACISNEMGIYRLAELMGHFDNDGDPAVETTRKYLHASDRETIKAGRKYGPST